MDTRLLLDPASEASGGGGTPALTPTPAPAAVPTPPPTNPAPTTSPGVPPAPASSAATVSIPIQDMQVYLQKERELSELKTAQQRAIDEEKSKQLRLLVEKGEAEKALQSQRESYEARLAEAERRHAEMLRSLHAKEKSNVVADGTAGYEFVSADAARQARALIDAELETTADSAGNVLVRQKGTGRPAADFIAEALKSPAYSHFLKPSTRGGGGGGGGSTASPGHAQDRPQTPAERQKAAVLAALERAGGNAPGLNGLYGRPAGAAVNN